PKFDKTYIYKLPNTKYKKFSNVYAYSFIVKTEKGTKIDNIIRQHLTIPLKLQGYFQSAALFSRTQVSGSATDNLSHIITLSTVHP
ncbi:28937_t:CDS:2, partial [Gigaspora margarita]